MTGREVTMIEQLASTLTKSQRLIVTLYYCDELTAEEIAGVMEISEDSVHRTLDHVIAHTRRFVAEHTPPSLAAVA